MLILWISGSKRRYCSTQEVGRKVFLECLRNLHISRTHTDGLLALKKTIRWYFLCTEYHAYWLLKSSCFELCGEKNYGLFWAKKLMERWYLLITGKFLFWTFRRWETQPFVERKSWFIDVIYLVFLSFLWYSRAWEIWFFVQYVMNSSESFKSRF